MHRCKGFSVLVLSLVVMVSLLAGCGSGGGDGATAAAGSAGAPVSGEPAAVSSNSAARVVNVEWNPYTNPDGTPLANLAGYKVYYGTSPGAYSSVVTVEQATSVALTITEPGTYYFTVAAVDTDGNESGYSEEVSGVVS